EADSEVLLLNRSAVRRLGRASDLRIVPNATHLFEEPGALERVAAMARDWFLDHLAADDVVGSASPRWFADRADAGRRLARRLQRRAFTDPLVLAIPRGGVQVGAVVAETIHADLDVVLARKLRMPGNPEYALGAIAESGDVYLNVPDDDIPPH